MRIKKGFTLREIGTDHVLVPEGLEVIDFNKLLTLNNSAKYIWENIKDMEFSVEDVAKLLTDKYNVTDETAQKDAELLISSLKGIGIIDE
ncbi:MAG: PqqD family protein [Bacteroidaceae bacterium]|nr:PqqD family protein [Bacteroidaceae bacterium]